MHDLGQTTYQQNSLVKLANRRDELGVLANDFNRMGARLQSLIGSQRQLLRDVSHELRSPSLACALRWHWPSAPRRRNGKLWPRLTRECDRLEALISEILVLARVDADNASAEEVIPTPCSIRRKRMATEVSPDQLVHLEAESQLTLKGLADDDRASRGQSAAQRPALQPGGRPADRNAVRCGKENGLW